MKKYMLGFFILILVFTSFGMNRANAEGGGSNVNYDKEKSSTTTPAGGCSSGDKFNRMTGQPCNVVYGPLGCGPGDKFSPINGSPCGKTTPSPVNFSYIKIGGDRTKYRFSVSSNKLFDKVVITPDCSDNKIEITSALGKEKCRSFKASLRPTNGIEYSVYLDSKDSSTRYARVKADVYYKGAFIGTNAIQVVVEPIGNNSNAPVISGVSAPQYLELGQKGTWKVSAYDKNKGDLFYGVVWGDEASESERQSLTTTSKQSATFIHSYSRAGNYTLTFVVGNMSGQNTETSLSVKVGKTDNSSSVKVISPNGGVYSVSQPLKVSWTAYKGDLDHYYVMLGNRQSRVSVNVTPDNHISKLATSYTVTNLRDLVNQLLANSHGLTAENIQDSYYVEVSPAKFNSSGDTLESLSSYGATGKLFTILPGTTTASKITVLSPNGGETWVKGATKTIKWKDANDISTHEVKLVPYNRLYPPTVPCLVYPCPSLVPVAYTIANTQGSSYKWVVGQTWQTSNVPDGQYTIQICQTGTMICDSSDGYFKIENRAAASYDDFAVCLKDKGAVFYGTFWCPHCQSQKDLFGSSARLLPYVECSTADGTGQLKKCVDKKITSYPTWEFANGSRLVGEIPLKQLAEKTSCSLPGTATGGGSNSNSSF